MIIILTPMLAKYAPCVQSIKNIPSIELIINDVCKKLDNNTINCVTCLPKCTMETAIGERKNDDFVRNGKKQKY